MTSQILRFVFLISLLTNFTTLNASVYDDDVLEIFSKILPRFVLMDNQKTKLKDEIDICVLHNLVDERSALSLIDKINNNYPNGLKNYKIKFTHDNYSNIAACQDSQLIFLFNSSDKEIADALLFAKKQKSLTVSYDDALLSRGVEISLFLGRKIVPYINIKALQKNGMEMDNLLLRISKIYIEMDK